MFQMLFLLFLSYEEKRSAGFMFNLYFIQIVILILLWDNLKVPVGWKDET